jgi:uncharacterized membrane protein YesL
MDVTTILARINLIGEWTARLAYVNLLWLLFSLAGLIIFGIVPATVAMFSIIQKWFMCEQVPVFQTFSETYRKEFVQSNLVGWLLLLVGFFLYIDLIFITSLEGTLFTVLTFVLITISFFYISVILYFFPIYVHYQLNKFEYIKYAFIMSLSYPHLTCLMLLGLFIVSIILLAFPVFLPFFMGSAASVVITMVVYKTFRKIEAKGIINS